MRTAKPFRESIAEQLDAILLRKADLGVEVDCPGTITEIEQEPQCIHKADYLIFHLGQKNRPLVYH